METFEDYDLIRVCPNPRPWGNAYLQLCAYAKYHRCRPARPPTPMILAGWEFSSDLGKYRVWQKTVEWAAKNDCSDIVETIPASDYRYTERLSDATKYDYLLRWNFKSRVQPESDVLAKHLETLQSRWIKIVGTEIGDITKPLTFIGRKGRRLLVHADPDSKPPWGGWSRLSADPSKRSTFTAFRASINQVIAPHEVDHIDFTTE